MWNGLGPSYIGGWSRVSVLGCGPRCLVPQLQLLVGALDGGLPVPPCQAAPGCFWQAPLPVVRWPEGYRRPAAAVLELATWLAQRLAAPLLAVVLIEAEVVADVVPLHAAGRSVVNSKAEGEAKAEAEAAPSASPLPTAAAARCLSAASLAMNQGKSVRADASSPPPLLRVGGATAAASRSIGGASRCSAARNGRRLGP